MRSETRTKMKLEELEEQAKIAPKHMEGAVHGLRAESTISMIYYPCSKMHAR